MSPNNQRIDRTGTKFEHEASQVVSEVIAQVKDSTIHLMQDHAKSDPSLKGGSYFVSDQTLEVMIIAYESGLDIDDVQKFADVD